MSTANFPANPRAAVATCRSRQLTASARLAALALLLILPQAASGQYSSTGKFAISLDINLQPESDRKMFESFLVEDFRAVDDVITTRETPEQGRGKVDFIVRVATVRLTHTATGYAAALQVAAPAMVELHARALEANHPALAKSLRDYGSLIEGNCLLMEILSPDGLAELAQRIVSNVNAEVLEPFRRDTEKSRRTLKAPPAKEGEPPRKPDVFDQIDRDAKKQPQ